MTGQTDYLLWVAVARRPRPARVRRRAPGLRPRRRARGDVADLRAAPRPGRVRRGPGVGARPRSPPRDRAVREGRPRTERPSQRGASRRRGAQLPRVRAAFRPQSEEVGPRPVNCLGSALFPAAKPRRCPRPTRPRSADARGRPRAPAHPGVGASQPHCLGRAERQALRGRRRAETGVREERQGRGGAAGAPRQPGARDRPGPPGPPASGPRWRRKRWKSRAIESPLGRSCGPMPGSSSSAACSRRSTKACTSGSLWTASETWRS